jgi:hypothetical protein
MLVTKMPEHLPFKTIKQRLFIIIILSLHLRVQCQDLAEYNGKFGFNLGVNFALGTHFQRIGFNVNGFLVANHIQLNSEARLYFSFKNLGPSVIYPECVLSQGIVFGYGKKVGYFNPFINSISNQTYYNSSFSYSYNWYFNNIKTKQVTGIIAIQAGEFTLITENDILAKQVLDRFRTGAVLLQYQYEDYVQVAVNCTMWTGQMGKSTPIYKNEVFWKCYMDTTNGIYNKFSHGLLSAQTKINVGFGQTIQFNAGIDAEQVRNAIQNNLIHDLKFIPKKWNKAKNCHIPMLDTNGNQYLYDKNQQIKKHKPYFNFFANPHLFY